MNEPTPVTRAEDGTPFQPLYDDVYCSRSGAGQARDVFVMGAGLPELLASGREVVVVETGFGLGLNASAALDELGAAGAGGAVLRYVSIELHPVAPGDLEGAHADLGLDSIGARAVREAYPRLLERGLAEVEIEGRRARLELRLGDGAAALAGIEGGSADALFLDGFAPAKNPGLWSDAVYVELARIARPGARLATYTAARAVREGLARAGFEVERLPGFGLKKHRLAGRWPADGA